MEEPNFEHRVLDSEANVTFVVKAYRQLSDAEVMQAIATDLRQHKKPKRGETRVINSTLGFT